MSDPVSGGGASKVAQQMLKEVQQTMQQADQLAQSQQTQPTTDFNNVLNAQQVNPSQDVQGVQGTAEVLRSATHSQRTSTVGANNAIGAVEMKPMNSGLQRVMKDIMQGQDKYGKILKMALSGRDFSHQELLMLQAGVYRFSQELELTSKVVEKSTSAVKQTLNTQV